MITKEQQIKDFVVANHIKGSELTDSNLNVWVAEAEDHELDGNGYFVEIRSFDCIHGHTVDFEVVTFKRILSKGE